MTHTRSFSSILLLVLPLVFPMTLTGCRTHRGEVGWVDQAPTVEHDYKHVKTVTGEASATYLFGLFGPSKLNLYDQARRDLMKKVDRNPDQRVINRTLDEITSGFPPTGDVGFMTPVFSMLRVYYNKTVYLSGEVIELEQ